MADAVMMTCPSCAKRLKCKAELIGKRAKCSCGTTFLVTESGSPAATAGGPTLAYGSGRPNAKQAQEQAEQSKLVRQTIILSVVLLVVIGGVVGIRYVGMSSSSKKPSLGEDDKVEEMISEQSGTEADKWLDGRGRMFSGMTDTQARSMVDHWYKLGAKKVIAFGGMMTMNVALELPAPGAQRQALVDWVNNWNERYDIKKDADVGQKYLLVRLHL